MNRSELLEQAEKIVNGHREDEYGSPERNFQTIAQLWGAYINAACINGTDFDFCLTEEDVAALMILMKVARISSDRQHLDSWVDIAGYAACGGEIATGGSTEEMPAELKETCFSVELDPLALINAVVKKAEEIKPGGSENED